MSLTANMWTSVSGLLAHGEKMNVIGNNISNVNTVGFKGSRMDFEDFVHQTVYAATGPAQVGRGTSIGAIYGDFNQGGFETSTNPTDLAISGKGFFQVKAKHSDNPLYTRAGNFRFDKDGYLVDPHGYVLQGWEVVNPTPTAATTQLTASNSNSSILGSGVPVDIRLASFSCSPLLTSNVSMASQLDSNEPERTVSTGGVQPFAAMLEQWNVTVNANGTINPPLGQNGFIHQQSITVYDEGGTPHVLTIYYDKVEEDVTNPNPNNRYWEYIVTMDPLDDARNFQTGGAVPANKRGILMTGSMTFDTAGNIQDMSAFVPTVGGAGFDDPTNWYAAPISSNGYPMFAANFTGRTDASEVWDPASLPNIVAGNPGTENPETMGYFTELNLGFRSMTNWWSSGPTDRRLSTMVKDANNLIGMGNNGLRVSPSMTSYGGKGSYDYPSTQNGYTSGDLYDISVSSNGVVTGRYSNGVSLNLYQITLFDFNSKENLRREGGNLFSQTMESGNANGGAAGTGSLGKIFSNNIEQSNVDLAREFVQMITTQRGFQANSKSITTTDTMLDTVINMKR